MLKTWIVASALTLCALAPLPAGAQGYPAQPVKMIVGFPPGGTTDVIGRMVAQGLTEALGKAFVVDNRAGASGTIGAGQVAKAEPDGLTLLMASSALCSVAWCLSKRGCVMQWFSVIVMKVLRRGYMPRYAARTCSLWIRSSPVPVSVTVPVSST